MISRFLPRVDGDTVLNYYALPLVGTNRKYYGANFITTKVNKEGTVVFVQIKEDIYDPDDFPLKAKEGDKLYLYFKVPTIFHQDMRKIIIGKYSEISEKAKNLIISNSGLQVNVRQGDEFFTSKLILALTKSKELKKYYYNKLKIKETESKLYDALSQVELAEKVSEDDFIES